MSSLSEELRILSLHLMKLSQSTKVESEEDHETVYGYYYSKGALDYRDKLVEALGSIRSSCSATEAFSIFLGTFPDEYPGPSK